MNRSNTKTLLISFAVASSVAVAVNRPHTITHALVTIFFVGVGVGLAALVLYGAKQ